MNENNQSITASWINVIAGIWLIISPFVLGFANSGAARTNDIILGVIVGILALIRAFSTEQTTWLSWINIIAGIWLFFSPFFQGYANETVPLWNNLILGVIVFLDAIWNSIAGARLTTGHHRVSTR